MVMRIPDLHKGFIVLAFVDESGDAGMKGKKGSSELFVVAAGSGLEPARFLSGSSSRFYQKNERHTDRQREPGRINRATRAVMPMAMEAMVRPSVATEYAGTG
jgi:hypothetical protein